MISYDIQDIRHLFDRLNIQAIDNNLFYRNLSDDLLCALNDFSHGGQRRHCITDIGTKGGRTKDVVWNSGQREALPKVGFAGRRKRGGQKE